MIETNDNPQPKPEQTNTQVTNPEQNPSPPENKENIPTINPPPKLQENQVVPEEEKKEEEISPPNPIEQKKEGETQLVQKQNENNIPKENQIIKEPPKEEKPQSDEIQEIEDIKPEPKKEDNGIKFTHPMNNYSSPDSIKEITTCPPDKLFLVISKRLNEIGTKLSEILKNHERYTLICLYYKIYSNFIQNQNIGRNPKAVFQQKDPTLRLKISNYDFQDVLVNVLKCQLTTENIDLILRSLKQKTETLYSYDEFLKNAYNINQSENEFKQIYKECSFYFDDYIYSFRHFIQDNQIDYKSAYSRACTGITTLQYELFKKFLAEIGFKLGEEKEYVHLFCALCEVNYAPDWNNLTLEASIKLNSNSNVLMSQKTLFEVADRKDITEEDFCKQGEVVNKSNKNNEWTKNIMNFTDETKKLHRKQFETFKTVFKNIHKKCLEYDISSLTKFFEESDCEIAPDGDIEIKDFRDAMVNIGVSYNVQLDTLINKFKNMKKKPREMMKLVEFLSIYNLFIGEEDEKESKDNVDIEKEQEKDSIKDKEIDTKEYVYKNAHRKFTQDDIDYINEIAEGIAEIIIDELHDGVTNFFRKKDKDNKGYITLDNFKDILSQDLKIDYKSDIENFQIFFDFILSDKMIEGEDIIETKKIINIIILYSGRDKPETIEKEEEEDIRLGNKKKSVLFTEEEDLTGTNAPNINNEVQNKILNAKLDDKEDKSSKGEMLINTQINTSVISFDKIMSEFAHYLFTNRIRFSFIFPSINLEKVINNQTISDETLKLGFQNASYPINDKEFSVIMSHFDPINKNKVLVEDLKHEISKYEPHYFKQNYQKIDPEEIENRLKAKGRELEKSAASNLGKKNFDSNLLNGMNKIQTFLDRNKLTVENFFYGQFCTKNAKNDNVMINQEKWKDTLLPKDKKKSEIIPNLNSQELVVIYNTIDTESKDVVTLGEIISFFNKYIKKTDNIINLDDQSSLSEYIKNELKILFDNFDTNKNDMISSENFYKCLKSVDHKATKVDAQNILAQYAERTANINRETFNKIMYSFIQKELVMQKEEKDYIMNLFREADIDKNGFLTRNQIKYLIKNKIGCNLTDAELDEILDKVDIDQENEIVIRDFVYLLDNINSIQKNKIENTISTKMNQDEELIPIMSLNLNLNMHRKIRPKDFISLYSDLPLSFIPSFTREEQQKNNLLPSSCLKPLSKDDITYEDIYPIQQLIYNDKKEPNKVQNLDLIHPYKKLDYFIPKISCKIYFDDYATGVSSPDETLFETANSQFKVVGRLLKISLFNNMYKVFVGNAISIDCIYKKEYQDRWYFESDDSKYNNNIIIRYNEGDYSNIDVIFEFILVIKKKVENTFYTIETSCGWCSIPMSNLQISRKEKLPIKGGSPLGASDISELDIRKKRTGFIPKLATLFEGQILSECPIRVKLFKDLTSEEKKYINYLPSLIVCHSAAMNMIAIYRQMLGEYILNHKDYLLKCIKDEYDLGNMFCKIADVPDAFRVMNEIWKEIVIDGANSEQKNDENYFRHNFEIFVKKINNILYAEKFRYNPLDPTELPRGDIKLMQDRDILLNSALRANQDKKFNKLEYRMDDYSYKPFTMDEINGQKGNSILEKIDEIITSISI